MPRILVFGDSITWGASDPEGGWVTRLRRWVDERMYKSAKGEGFDYPIYNLGISGEKTEDLLKRFDSEVTARIVEVDYKPIIVFAIGVNDSQYLGNEKKRRVTPEEFTKNIQELTTKAKGYASKVAFVGLTPVDETKVAPVPWAPEKSYRNEYVQEFDGILKSLCQQNNIPFIEILQHFSSQPYQQLLSDGLHPTNEGHQILFTLIKDSLVQQQVIEQK